jgi:hypothetical protein
MLAIVLIFIIAMAFAMNALKEWLVSFEASQPTAKCDQVFAELFHEPDWEQLYNLAGEQDSHGVNAQSFASYMEEKIGDTKLTCIETSAGLSGDKKFIVRCGTEKVATFTLTCRRLRDAGFSWLLVLLNFAGPVPLVGWILAWVPEILCLFPSKK